MLEAIAELTARGVKVVSVMPLVDDSPLCSHLAQTGTPVYEAPTWVQFTRIMRELRPRAAIAFGLFASLRTRTARLFLFRVPPKVIDARNGLEFGRARVAWLVDRSTQNLVDCYMTNSRAVGDMLIARGFRADRVRINESALGAAWQRRVDKFRNPVAVAMVGNSRPEKNHELGLRALAACEGPVEVFVYTDDASSALRTWHSLGCDETKVIQFIEGHTVTPEDLAGCAILLHPSRSESMPRAILEARSQGLHVVATDVGDTRSAVGDGGVVVTSGDLSGLTAGLNDLLGRSRSNALVTPSVEVRTTKQYCDELLEIAGLRHCSRN